jgi:shikimate kinase
MASFDRPGLTQLPIALAGFMGAGKTTVGRLLAESLQRPFYDTDSYLETTTGRTVEDFFLKQEEPEFRRLEAEAVAELLRRGPTVIALGGGALLDPRSRTMLRERTLLVHLHVNWEDLSDRLPTFIDDRPLLRGKSVAEIHELYLQRLPTYTSAAMNVDGGRQSPAQVVDTILRALRAGPGSHIEYRPFGPG